MLGTEASTDEALNFDPARKSLYYKFMQTGVVPRKDLLASL